MRWFVIHIFSVFLFLVVLIPNFWEDYERLMFPEENSFLKTTNTGSTGRGYTKMQKNI